MGTLRFVCPTKGCEVDTNIEVDPASFKGLYSEQLGCPECLEVHRLSKIKAWVSDNSPPNPPSDIKAGNSGVELSFGPHPGQGVM